MQSKASTVAQYLAELPAERHAAITAVRQLVLDNLDPAYQETMQYGMIGWSVPHAVYPAGYHTDAKQPLPFAALASQKNHMALYLMCTYLGGEDDPEAQWFRTAWAKTGKKLDMGKSCVRFKKLDDLALDVIAEAVRRMPAQGFIARYEQGLAASGKTPAKARAGKQPAAKKTGTRGT
jgi:hypothetical protein